MSVVNISLHFTEEIEYYRVLSKINISIFQVDRKFEGHGFVIRRLLCATLVKQGQFIYFIYFIFEGKRV